MINFRVYDLKSCSSENNLHWLIQLALRLNVRLIRLSDFGHKIQTIYYTIPADIDSFVQEYKLAKKAGFTAKYYNVEFSITLNLETGITYILGPTELNFDGLKNIFP